MSHGKAATAPEVVAGLTATGWPFRSANPVPAMGVLLRTYDEFEPAGRASGVGRPMRYVVRAGEGELKRLLRVDPKKLNDEDLGRRLALVGDASARPFAAWLRDETRLRWRGELAGPAGVVDLVGRTSLAELASLLLAAEVFVGNDSGVMHLAGALGVPTVGLFGSTNPDWTAPLGTATRVLAAAGFPCRPCYRRTCNQDRFCLATIGAEEVLAAVAAVTGRGGKDPT